MDLRQCLCRRRPEIAAGVRLCAGQDLAGIVNADRERSREAGFDHHLVKPIDLEELQNILSAVEK